MGRSRRKAKAVGKLYLNIVVCWKCEGALEILSDDLNEVLDDIPKTCPNPDCRADWSKSRRMMMRNGS